MITNGFTYIAFLIFFAGCMVMLEKKTQAKIFGVLPPVVLIYLITMLVHCKPMGYESHETRVRTFKKQPVICYDLFIPTALRYS